MISFIEKTTKDHPTSVTIFIILLVLAHAISTALGLPNCWQSIISMKDPPMDLYVAMLSVSALQASFAGVIVVFGLSTQPQAFRDLRVRAGKALVDNWMSISYSGFLSAACALIASLMALMGGGSFAPWAFELSVLFCVHGIIRLLWLLKDLIQVVRNDDARMEQESNER
jgi:hypothetical protein